MEVSDTVEQYKQLAFQPQYQNVRPPAWSGGHRLQPSQNPTTLSQHELSSHSKENFSGKAWVVNRNDTIKELIEWNIDLMKGQGTGKIFSL